MNKKIIIIIVTAAIVVIGLFTTLYLIQHKKLANLPEVQTKITNSFKTSGFDATYKTSDTTIKGTLDKSLNFKGDILVKDAVVQNIIKVGDKTYTKLPKDDKWQIQQSQTFISQLNTITHPDYIQLQKRLANVGGNFQYQIIFEKPGQNTLKKMSKEALSQFQMTGTVLLDKYTFELKEIKIHQGTEATNEVTVDYTANPNPPVIAEPKI